MINKKEKELLRDMLLLLVEIAGFISFSLCALTVMPVIYFFIPERWIALALFLISSQQDITDKVEDVRKRMKELEDDGGNSGD